MTDFLVTYGSRWDSREKVHTFGCRFAGAHGRWLHLPDVPEGAVDCKSCGGRSTAAHHVAQANPCEAAECVACGAWDPDDPGNDCPAWASLTEKTPRPAG